MFDPLLCTARISTASDYTNFAQKNLKFRNVDIP